MYVSRKMPISLLPEKRAKFEDEISAGDDVTFVVIKTPEGEAYIRIAAIESWTATASSPRRAGSTSTPTTTAR